MVKTEGVTVLSEEEIKRLMLFNFNEQTVGSAVDISSSCNTSIFEKGTSAVIAYYKRRAHTSGFFYLLKTRYGVCSSCQTFDLKKPLSKDTELFAKNWGIPPDELGKLIAKNNPYQ